jgi:hypothetical protein
MELALPRSGERRVGDDAKGGKDEEEQEHERGERAESVYLEVLRLRGHLSRLLSVLPVAAGRLPLTED